MACLAYKSKILRRENTAESQSAVSFCMTAFLKGVFLPWAQTSSSISEKLTASCDIPHPILHKKCWKL